MHGYTFDRDRLKFLDAYRHEIIHGNDLGKGMGKADDEVDFLMRTVLFFMGMVNLHYDIRLDPYYAMTGQELPAAAKCSG
jgi:hypothetical protein